MFKSKAHKASKSANPSSVEWEILTGNKENLARRDDADLPPQGVLIKQTPWAPSSRVGSGQKDRTTSGPGNRPRTSSLPEIDQQDTNLSQHDDRSTDAFEKHAMNRAFERMLDELQIPAATRSKLATLDTPVKAAMLKSSHVLNIDVPLTPPSIGAANSPLRKARSATSISLDRPDHSRSISAYADIPYEPRPLSSLGAAAIPSLLNLSPWHHELKKRWTSQRWKLEWERKIC